MHIRKIAIAKEQYLEIYVFVPCIVIQLCNVNQQNASFFKINVVIQFFVSSTCFEHHVFVIRKTICTCSFVWHVFHAEMYVCVFVWKVSKGPTLYYILACLTSANTNYVTSFVRLAFEQLRHSGKASAPTGLRSFFFQHLISHLSSKDVTLDG